MGCVKSKRSASPGHNANSTEKAGSKWKKKKGEKAYLVYSEMDSVEKSPQVNPVLLEYAHRLSEEIVARAVQQWVEVDRRYMDIPYIESDIRIFIWFVAAF
uniref:Small membrane A-kinase anchor protein n=1 Tax=Gouania willdenowi TaxID=441366 RepID=A0A8C5GJW4_GOUWI